MRVRREFSGFLRRCVCSFVHVEMSGRTVESLLEPLDVEWLCCHANH